MAQPDPEDLIRKAIAGDAPGHDVVSALVDREAATVVVKEGQLIDFKSTFDDSLSRAPGELAKDILGFSNTHGGLILFGVDDTGRVVGHPPLVGKTIRKSVGPYVGTRVLFEVGLATVQIRGQPTNIPFLLIHRSTSMRPGLLRQDVELRAGIVRKVK